MPTTHVKLIYAGETYQITWAAKSDIDDAIKSGTTQIVEFTPLYNDDTTIRIVVGPGIPIVIQETKTV